MDTDLLRRARRVFLELSTLDAEGVDRELARIGAGDHVLCDAVRALLQEHAEADRVGLMSAPTAAKEAQSESEREGSRVGKYKLLQEIGEGGFGTVFLAEQTEPVRRRVALKIIKRGMDTRRVIARFEAERQALALMDHPHIAKVLDAGTTDSGRPYFVMEYVVGDAITKFADSRTLDISARLELFTQVCSAVQHAHTKGIIHRDLKPANVLVSTVDGKPFAKVIDFGIAKATAAPLTEMTLLTEHRQLLGTPEYMSPEQAEGSVDIDTRTDVYALGVLLYELLSGVTPFDSARLRSAAWAEMQRIIKEEDPPPPSMRLSRQPELMTSVAAVRRSDPPRLGAIIRGELDWIVMKALEKERGRRYASPAEFAEDVEHHRKGEPVRAAPPSRLYRMRKFARRNRWPVIGVGAVAATLLLGIVATSAALFVAQHNAEVAQFHMAAATSSKDETQQAHAALAKERDALAQQSRIARHDSNMSRSLYYQNQGLLALAFDHAQQAHGIMPSWTAGMQIDALTEEATRQWRLFDVLNVDGTPSAMAVVSEGSAAQLIVAGHDRVRVFDLASGVQAIEVKVKPGVERIVQIPERPELILVIQARSMESVDLGTGRVIAHWGSESQIDAVATSKDRVAVTTRDSTALVLSLSLEEIARTLWPDEAVRNAAYALHSIAISPDGKTVIFSTMGVSDDRAVWNPDDGVVRVQSGVWVNRYRFLDDRTLVGTASQVYTEGMALHRFIVDDGSIRHDSVLADIPVDLAGDGDVGALSVREAVYVGRSGAAIADLTAHSDVRARTRATRFDSLLLSSEYRPSTSCVSTNGSWLAVANDGKVQVFQRAVAPLYSPLNEGSCPVYTGDRLLWAYNSAGVAMVLDLTDPAGAQPVELLALDQPEGGRHSVIAAYAASWDGRAHALRLFDMANEGRYALRPTNHRILVFPPSTGEPGSTRKPVRIDLPSPERRGEVTQTGGGMLEFSLDGRVLLSRIGSRQRTGEFGAYEATSGKKIENWPAGPEIGDQVTMVRGHDRFLDVTADRLTYRVRDIGTGKVVYSETISEPIHTAACGNSAGKVAIQTVSGSISIIDATDGKRVPALTSSLIPVAWSPAGDVFVARGATGAAMDQRALVLARADDADILGILQSRATGTDTVMFRADACGVLHTALGAEGRDPLYRVTENLSPDEGLARVRKTARLGELWTPSSTSGRHNGEANAELKANVGKEVQLMVPVVKVQPTRSGGHFTLYLDDESDGVLLFVRRDAVEVLKTRLAVKDVRDLVGARLSVRGILRYYGGYDDRLVGRLQIELDEHASVDSVHQAAPEHDAGS